MLVLQRRAGESVVIGDNIKVVVVEVRGQRARLGFDCPDDVAIVRSELPKLRAEERAGRSTAYAPRRNAEVA
jgi:carbon storage regulator